MGSDVRVDDGDETATRMGRLDKFWEGHGWEPGTAIGSNCPGAAKPGRITTRGLGLVEKTLD